MIPFQSHAGSIEAGIAPAEGRGPCLRCGLGEAVFLPFPEGRPFPSLSERRRAMVSIPRWFD